MCLLQADVDHARLVSSTAGGSTEVCYDTPHAYTVHLLSGSETHLSS